MEGWVCKEEGVRPRSERFATEGLRAKEAAPINEKLGKFKAELDKPDGAYLYRRQKSRHQARSPTLR